MEPVEAPDPGGRSGAQASFEQRGALAVFRDQWTVSPAGVVTAVCLVQLLLWTIIPALTTLALPIDVIEGYLWGREWVIATYKHPALPSWALEISRLITGRIGWPAYLVSQLFIVATLALVYVCGRDLMDARRGALAVLLSMGVFFFTWASAEFNHNIAQMPFWIGFVWALWKATRSQSIGHWLLVAAFATACVYTKLSCVILLLTGGLWTLWDPQARRSLATPGPWLALVVFLAAISPLMAWLVRNDFLPLQYAERRANSSGAVSLPTFLLGQLERHGGLLAMLALAGLFGGKESILSIKTKVAFDAAVALDDTPVDADARRYLLIMALAPPLFLMVSAVFVGMHLKTAWTASMSTLSALTVVCLLGDRLTPFVQRRITIAALVLLIATPLAYGVDALTSKRRDNLERPQVVTWPADAIAERTLAVWAQATSAPLKIVAGETRIAGFAALKAPGLPSLMTEGEYWRAPWVTPERLQREGALIIWAEPGGVPPSRMQDLAKSLVGSGQYSLQVQHLEVPWPRAPGRHPLQLYVVAVPPAATADPDLAAGRHP